MKKQKKHLGIPILIVFLMVSSTIGFMYGGSEDTKEEYNGHIFTKTNQGWLTYIDGEKYFFKYLPKDLENINFNFELNYDNLYLAYDPEYLNNDIMFGMETLRVALLSKTNSFQFACFNEIGCLVDLSIVSCEDDKNIIGFSSGNGINQEGNCLMISEKFIKNSERISYSILGIM